MNKCFNAPQKLVKEFKEYIQGVLITQPNIYDTTVFAKIVDG